MNSMKNKLEEFKILVKTITWLIQDNRVNYKSEFTIFINYFFIF